MELLPASTNGLSAGLQQHAHEHDAGQVEAPVNEKQRSGALRPRLLRSARMTQSGAHVGWEVGRQHQAGVQRDGQGHSLDSALNARVRDHVSNHKHLRPSQWAAADDIIAPSGRCR